MRAIQKISTKNLTSSAERDRQAFHEEMKKFEERAERDRQGFREEIKQYEERAEKDRKSLHEEMKAFKDEMRVYREESEKDRKSLHEEMKAFKDEMGKYKKEQDEEWKKWRKEWSNIAKKMGTIVEDLIAPVLRPTLKKYFNCEVSLEGQRMFRRKKGEDYEVDAIAACDDKVFMIEARSTPRDTDVREIKEKSERFFEFFPEFKGKKLIIIFGSITFPENVLRYASNMGIYAMGWREWEYMDILNFDDVKSI
ncbi:hypothetical protein JZK55_12000 [Dissulfurispira thermophila]|uniref:DUF3782 domain-containing protein n=2 Tax=root TaxID=1 RepID=A0A7G1H108_9BACT|nr:hypothetical protein [Dissulfurispira thermophila]BCB96278.1 hypothetical protein JZK55_12000 [Dissulfurispira thermophila]